MDRKIIVIEGLDPSLVIYLRVDPAVGQKLMTNRYEGREEKKTSTKRISST